MFSVVLWTLPLLCGGSAEPASFLFHFGAPKGDPTRPRYEPYEPHAGDLVFFDKPSPLWDVLDWIAGTGPPDHLGIVIHRDGRPCLLEAGPDAHLHCYIQDTVPRLQAFHGRVYVRRIRCPLTQEQSAALTEFALRQEGKRYAIFRLLRQITPIRARGPIRTELLGHTFLDRNRWFCSEVVIAAGAYIGIFDPHKMLANSIYARDVLDDHRYDLSHLYEPAARWCPTLGIFGD